MRSAILYVIPQNGSILIMAALDLIFKTHRPTMAADSQPQEEMPLTQSPMKALQPWSEIMYMHTNIIDDSFMLAQYIESY